MKRAVVASLLTVAAIAAHAQTVTYFALDGGAAAIAAGPDGNLWLTTPGGIVKMTPTGDATTYPLRSPIGGPSMITAGPDGSIWFTEPSQARIGAITMSGDIRELSLPNGMSPLGIAAASDGVIWFGATGTIGSIVNGTIALTPLPNDALVLDIAADRDRSIQFVEYPTNAIGRFQPPTAIIGFDRPFSEIRTNPPACCAPRSVTRASDASLWFALAIGNSIARLANGTVTAFEPGVGAIRTVTSGGVGRVWFGTSASNGETARIGSVSLDGTLETLVDLPYAVGSVLNMTTDANGDVWAVLTARSCLNTCPPPPPLTIAHVHVNAVPHHRAAGR